MARSSEPHRKRLVYVLEPHPVVEAHLAAASRPDPRILTLHLQTTTLKRVQKGGLYAKDSAFIYPHINNCRRLHSHRLWQRGITGPVADTRPVAWRPAGRVDLAERVEFPQSAGRLRGARCAESKQYAGRPVMGIVLG